MFSYKSVLKIMQLRIRKTAQQTVWEHHYITIQRKQKKNLFNPKQTALDIKLNKTKQLFTLQFAEQVKY